MQKSLVPGICGRFMNTTAYFIKEEVNHWLNIVGLVFDNRVLINQGNELGLGNSLCYRIQSILVQKYYGDITVVPDIKWRDYAQILTNPDENMVRNYTIIGEKCTWPRKFCYRKQITKLIPAVISLIKNHLAIELCIDEILLRLRVRKLNDPRVKTMLIKKTSTPVMLRPLTPASSPNALPNVSKDEDAELKVHISFFSSVLIS